MGLIPLGILSSAGSQLSGTYELIESRILATTTASITFDNLSGYSATYKHLQIRYASRATVDSGTIFATFNGVTGTSYASHRIIANGSTVTSDAFTSRANAFVGSNGTSDNAANVFAAGVIDILDFSSTTKNKTTRALAGVSGTFSSVTLTSGLFNSTAAVTSITLFGNVGNLVTGSRFSLYGIR
jgi:hypothetical protein